MKRVISVLLLISLFFTFSSCGIGKSKVKGFDIHTEAQSKYLNGDYAQINLYASGKEELSIPKPITIEWKNDGKTCRVDVLEIADGSKIVYSEETTENKLDIYNLKVGAEYEINITDLSSGSVIYYSTIHTVDIAPRNLNVDGLTNVRDVCGWTANSRQGLLYRSSKFTDDETGEKIITDKGISILTKDLGVKTEIDLRRVDNNENGNLTESILGNDVNYISLPMKSGGNIINLNKDAIVDLFKILADESNYPIVLHCSIGTDRTGMVSFLINGLLGADDDSLYRDFLFSNFGTIGSVRTPSMIKTYIQTVNIRETGTLSEQIYSYLVSIGVPNTDIDSVINILSEK